ncbi:MAG: thiamine pyrophosphate-dependent dehydrogenase E1 component subunit alpha [Alphaproteobacteria bacterium]|nr:thiamine pyrophosphate-dependent dehydrogenase E1 component subunit alpha [Alphaproteobacteria bacterium]
MILIRTVEQTLLDLFSEGLLRGTVHTCLGQEASAAGVINALDKDRDIVCSNHRGHGHYLAYCADVEGLIAEVMGLPQGVCGGIGGSQHLHRKNFYSNGILGGMSPIATGFATAEKSKNSGAVTVVFHGDGAMAEGAIYESFNLAALWQLPILFAVESNKYAQSTRIESEIAGSFLGRAEAFGLTAAEVDGNDVLAVNDAATEIVSNIRTGKGPAMLVLDTYRMGPHSKGDDDRNPQEIESHRDNCPITRTRTQLDADWCDETKLAATAKVDAVVNTLKASRGRTD